MGKSMYAVIDMENDPRKDQYKLFTSYANPAVGLTAKVDVTDLVRFCKERQFSFYAAMIRVVTLAANRVPELRRRIHEKEVREYERCSASVTEMAPSGVYYYCTLAPQETWEQYIPYAIETRGTQRRNPSLREDPDAESMLFITCVPTLSFDQLVLPYDASVISNPEISWGKYEEDWHGRLMMPLSILCHHALADGVHIAAFYKNVEEELKKLPQ